MITILTAWYNEEFLAPLFLNHYNFADEIIILLDESTDDDTLDMIARHLIQNHYSCPKIDIKKLKMPNGMDDRLKQEQVNAEYRKIKNGWVIEADADEFIKMPNIGMYKFLETITADVVKVEFYQMYQHLTESSLNFIDPVFEQRRHGKKNGFSRWNKPSIIRAGKNFTWTVGHHEINATNEQIHSKMIKGAHWYMCDKDLAIKRRIQGRRNRMSTENYDAKLSAHNFKISGKDIADVCRAMNNCPQVF